MRKRALGITLAVFLGACRPADEPRVPTQHPFLRIETGMHTARIDSIAVDTASRFLVTGSWDRTVRVWDLVSGRLLGTLRPPIGEGNEGKIYAVAISPGGELVAAGGWWTGYQEGSQFSIYLFDRRSGRLLRRLSGLPNIAISLAKR